MPIPRSAGWTAKVRAMAGSAVAITVPSRNSMKNAPATRKARSRGVLDMDRTFELMTIGPRRRVCVVAAARSTCFSPGLFGKERPLRRVAVEQALRHFAPRIPRFECESVLDHALSSRGLSVASPGSAAWLSLVAYVRHTFTDYDDLLADGYDVESARHFVLDDI